VAPSDNDVCERMVDMLGLAGGTLESCISLLPDQFYVEVQSEAGGYAGPVVVDAGALVTARGCAAGAAWLQRARVYELDVKNPVAVVESLAWLGALPEGFDASHFTDHEDRTGATRFSAHPFRLELRRPLQKDPATSAFTEGALLGRGAGAELLDQERAVLTGDADYLFTWTLERRIASGDWSKVSESVCAR
jgi:hypothetical protein